MGGDDRMGGSAVLGDAGGANDDAALICSICSSNGIIVIALLSAF